VTALYLRHCESAETVWIASASLAMTVRLIILQQTLDVVELRLRP